MKNIVKSQMCCTRTEGFLIRFVETPVANLPASTILVSAGQRRADARKVAVRNVIAEEVLLVSIGKPDSIFVVTTQADPEDTENFV